jgi:hypothetical protein
MNKRKDSLEDEYITQLVTDQIKRCRICSTPGEIR